jgi:hypothetical protein
MRYRSIIILATLLVLCAVAAVFAAGALLPGGAASARAADPVVLAVQHNGTLIKQYTLADLQALGVYNGYTGIKNSAGNVIPSGAPVAVTGVRVGDVLQNALGSTGITSQQSVDVVAADAYVQTLTGDQVTTATATNWVMFDNVDPDPNPHLTPLTNTDIQGQLACILAWARGGSALPSDEGPLRLCVADSLNEPVVMRGSDSAYQVVTLNVRDQVLPSWSLAVIGLKAHGKRPTDVIDTQSYQSCAAPGCHGVGWKASDGVRWTGVALYMLIGQVDGGKDMTYNAALARKGYRIRLYSSTGKTVTLSSKVTVRRSSIVVANSAGGALTSEFYPLRLVGPSKYVPASKRLGQIVKIKLLPW